MIRGFTGNDDLQGRDGTDRIDGGAGDDRISGGNDQDIYRGSQGRETFVYEKGATDLIRDFESGIDGIDVSRLDPVRPSGYLRWTGDDRFGGRTREIIFFIKSGSNGGTLRIDLDGDEQADGEVRPTNVTSISLSDLIV